jgi:hypothetical protein
MNTMMKIGLPTVLLLVAGALTSYSPAASAQQMQGKLLQNTGNNLCLAATNIGDLVITKECFAPPLQTWIRLKIVDTSDYLIRNINSNRCLASSGSGTVTTEAVCDANIRQRWKVLNTTPFVPTQARYRSVLNGGYLTSKGVGAVYTAPLETAPQAEKLQVWAY